MTVENFREYGSFANMMRPEQYKNNGDTLKFFRELVILNLGRDNNAAISTLYVRKRPMIVDATECHGYCGEGVFPIDGNVVIHVGPGTVDGNVPYDKIEAFRVPEGTFVVLRPGIWHYEPFAPDKDLVHTLIVLPERVYGNDCCFVEIPEENRIEIVF